MMPLLSWLQAAAAKAARVRRLHSSWCLWECSRQAFSSEGCAAAAIKACSNVMLHIAHKGVAHPFVPGCFCLSVVCFVVLVPFVCSFFSVPYCFA